jgi:hypothetical protein
MLIVAYSQVADIARCGGVPAFGDEVDISRTAAEVQLRGGLLYQTLR